MKPPGFRTGIYFLIDLSLLVFSLFNLPLLLERPRIPFDLRKDEQGIVVSRILDEGAAGALQLGDHVLTIDGHQTIIPEVFEFVGDVSAIDRTAPVEVRRGGQVIEFSFKMIPFYESPRFLIISVLVGFTIWLIGVFILFQRPRDHTASALHWTLVSFGVNVMITWGAVNTQSVFPLISRGIWITSYTLIPAGFFFFTTLYPRHKDGPMGAKVLVSFAPAGILIAGQLYYHLRALYLLSVHDYEVFQEWFDVFNLFLIVYVGGAVLNFIHSYVNARSNEERRRLEWILWGLCIGPMPFLLLIKLPQVLGQPSGIVPEEYTTIFFILIPFAFAISLVRYQFLDIQLVIHRSLVYGALTLFVALIFFLAVLLLTTLFGEAHRFGEYLLIAVVAVVVSLSINPLRTRIARVVDETMFVARASFRQLVRDIGKELRESLSTDELLRTLAERVAKSLPKYDVNAYLVRGDSFVLQHACGQRLQEKVGLTSSVDEALRSGAVQALPESVKVRKQEIGSGLSDWIRGQGWSLCLPLITESKELKGLLVLVSKPYAQKLEEEEIDLLNTVANQAAEVLERLLLQERIILEREAKKRADELSELKSYFVSSVSHELRTPLTSIRMFAETLRHRGWKNDRKRREYLRIIEGETERLSRLIDNVLDFAKIDRGEKEYTFTPTDIARVVRSAVEAMRYQVEKQGVRLTVRVAKRLPRINADADALEEAIINLLSNAVKYSLRKKPVALIVSRHQREVVIEVRDRGIGIPKTEQVRIFDKFYRSGGSHTRQVGGAGLGLPVVKHIVEAHRGQITVWSEPGKGSLFTIHLPLS